MVMRMIRLVTCVMALLALGAPRVVAGDGRAPAAVVGQLHDSLLGVLQKAEDLGYQGRYEQLGPILADAYDLSFMAEKVVGRQWKRLGESDRQRWCQTFGELTRANYAARFKDYRGQTFETLGEEPAANETVLVRTRVRDPGGEDVDLTYRLYRGNGRWQVVDVYALGTVSELALRRSEYSAVLKRDGFDALLGSVNDKIAALAAGEVEE
jgi:phospholipid transport system substrate-binding protein